MGLLETAAAALIGGERRTEIVARNISNVQTPGYKREIAYAEAADVAVMRSTPDVNGYTVEAQGVLKETGRSLDIALEGAAHVALRDGDQYVFSRGGSFQRTSDGLLADVFGRVLQQPGGGDVLIETDNPEILENGTVLDGGVPVATIAMIDLPLGAARTRMSWDEFSAQPEGTVSALRQGMLEGSNVVLSDEMIEIMQTQRIAESGAQIIRTYDQLMSQAITAFGKGR